MGFFFPPSFDNFGAGTKLKKFLRDERGQNVAATFPFIVMVMVLLLGVAAFVVKIRPAQVSVAAAARACARQAVETLNQSRGLEQSRQAAREVLTARHLDPERAEITVTPLGPWGRAVAVECRIRYSVNVSHVPFLALFSDRPEHELTAVYRLSIEPYKSRWEGP